MRCPYCGGLNQDRASFCAACGRDLTRPVPSNMPRRPATPPQGRPFTMPSEYVPSSPTVMPRPASPPSQSNKAAGSTNRRGPVTAGRIQTPVEPLHLTPQPEPEPAPPAPFPPQTMAQFEALLAGNNYTYTVIESSVGDGKKQVVRITYPRCPGWQQAATLLKALKELQDPKCDIVFIQGVLSQQSDTFTFTLGQLQFDRNVRLGGKIGNRYIVETDNGLANTAVRFVLNP